MSGDLSVADQQGGVAVSFMLEAEASPSLLPRLLQPFARRDLTPDRMFSHRSGGTVLVEIAVHAMPACMVHLVEGNLRQVVGVHRVSQARPAELRQVA